MSKVKLIFYIVTVSAAMISAGTLLYRQTDPHLTDAPFIDTPSNPSANDVHQVTTTPETMSTETATVLSDPSIAITTPTTTFNTVTSSTAPTDSTPTSSTISSTATADTTTVTDSRTTQRSQAAATTMVLIIKPTGTLTCPVTQTTATTAHAVMQQAAKQCGFVYAGENYSGLGFFVERLDDVSADSAKGYDWIYSVNGVKATLGVSQQSVQPGDTITWTYEIDY